MMPTTPDNTDRHLPTYIAAAIRALTPQQRRCRRKRLHDWDDEGAMNAGYDTERDAWRVEMPCLRDCGCIKVGYVDPENGAPLPGGYTRYPDNYRVPDASPAAITNALRLANIRRRAETAA